MTLSLNAPCHKGSTSAVWINPQNQSNRPKAPVWLIARNVSYRVDRPIKAFT